MDPVRLVTTMVEAVNAHDIERSCACFSDDVVLILRPEVPRLRDATHRGRDYLRRWLRGLFDRDFKIQIAVEKAEGNAVRTVTTTWMNTTRRLGLAPLVGFEDYVVDAGRITSLTWTATEETRRKFVVLRRRVLIAGVGGVLLVASVAWWLLGR